MFIKGPILNYFDPKYCIYIKKNAFGYTISGILSQLISDDLSQWHLVAFFSQKIIPTKT